MELTRRQLFAGLLVPLVPRRLLASPASPPLPVSGIAIAHKMAINPPNRYNNDTFYRMGADFIGPDYQMKPLEAKAIIDSMLEMAADILHGKVMEAAAGRKVIWCAPMETVGFVDIDHVGPVGPIPRCRHIAVWDMVKGGWVHRIDVEVAFVWPGGSHVRYCGQEAKIGDTINVRRPIRWLENQPG